MKKPSLILACLSLLLHFGGGGLNFSYFLMLCAYLTTFAEEGFAAQPPAHRPHNPDVHLPMPPIRHPEPPTVEEPYPADEWETITYHSNE